MSMRRLICSVSPLVLSSIWLAALPAAARTSPNPPRRNATLERIVARVNNDIITSEDLAKGEAQINAQLRQPGADVPSLEQQKRDLLRDLIDRDLLLERAKTLGISAETATIRRLDQMRKKMNLPTLQALRAAVRAQGESYSQLKQNISDGILTQQVIQQDVAPRISISSDEIAKYYNAHKGEFVRHNSVRLSEILIPTAGKTGKALAFQQDLANQIQVRAAHGESFSQMAKQYSASRSASHGGDIGFFERKDLAPQLASAVFKLPLFGVTPVLHTANGLLILKVEDIHHAGQETLTEARNQIENKIYQQKMDPELQRYLTRLRSEAYIKVAPGYVDTGAGGHTTVDLTHFERVLPQDLPKPIEKKSKGGLQ